MSPSEEVKFSNVRGLYLRKYGMQQKVISRRLCNESENFQFFKNTFFLVLYSHLLMIFHWIVIITKKFEVLGYDGLCWSSLAFLDFVALNDFFKQKSNNQMSKPISEWDSAIWITVSLLCVFYFNIFHKNLIIMSLQIVSYPDFFLTKSSSTAFSITVRRHFMLLFPII